jgi:hypothetical protein
VSHLLYDKKQVGKLTYGFDTFPVWSKFILHGVLRIESKALKLRTTVTIANPHEVAKIQGVIHKRRTGGIMLTLEGSSL